MKGNIGIQEQLDKMVIKTFRKLLFISAYSAWDRGFYPTYKRLVENQWESRDELKKEQEKKLRNMINFCYKDVPYYHKLFKELKLTPDDIKTIEDLQKIPIINKDTIKENWESFKPLKMNKMKYYVQATGGSTGTPFNYRLYKSDRFLGRALLYRGWGYCGYEMGDKMVLLGGSSLAIGTKSNLVTMVHEIAKNIKKLSSFDMGEKEMKQYVNIINSFKPKFIRGYASSIYFLSKWIEENGVKVYQPLGVFTTAEKLYPNMKEKIGDVFNCDVYDAYGLNDGGVSAYECPEHGGQHIDTERSIMEIVDKNGNQLENGEGEILATSLYNFAMPFIRYNTGDLGHIIDDVCGCGRGYMLLKEVVGREKEFLITPTGKHVHGAAFFNNILAEITNVNAIMEFQVIQQKIDELIINIVCKEDFNEKQLDKIRKIIKKRSEGWNVEFKFVDEINRTKGGKYKFIINEIEEVNF